jgi:alkanesulfonate monooxygenase SsuD/methylene tetrahydromethanopterin reductase-like flavin-dependent oxidoreductase (luciferase family)
VQRPGPPVMIGASGERSALRVVAEHADIWNCAGRGVAEFRRKSQVLDGHCAAIGRDPAQITRSMQVLVRMDDPAPARAQLRELISVGATHLVLAPVPPWPQARWSGRRRNSPLATPRGQPQPWHHGTSWPQYESSLMGARMR